MPNAVTRMVARIMRGLALEVRSTHVDYRGGHAPSLARTCRPHAHVCEAPADGRVEGRARRVAPLRRLHRWFNREHRSTKGGV